MNKEDLKNKIVEANAAYRAGDSLMSDAEFDKLVEEFQQNWPDEYDEFRDSLNEGSVEYGTKVKHPFIMGSLNKVTVEKPDDIFKFIKKHVVGKLNVSAKVDGISCRLHYENGKLIQASTRGDGEQGTDITDKIFFVKNVPTKINVKDTIDIRGELVIFKSDFSGMSGFANPRNATAGIINRKDYDKADIAKVSFVGYTVLGDKYSKDDQFSLLKTNGFYTAWYETYGSDEYTLPEFIDTLTEDLVKDHDYETDGLVISDTSYKNEAKYRPDAAVAVKGNMTFATTKIIDVEWRGPSKDGRFSMVAQLEPVQLCGTTVSQATLNNFDFVEKMGIKYGSVVKIQKRGEIIPAVIAVVDNTDTVDIEPIEECPCCGSKLVNDGLFMRCMNKACADQVNSQLTYFIKKLGVKSISSATLKNFNITSYDDLIAFRPDKKYKTQIKLYDELLDKVFTKSKQDLLAATNFTGLSEVLINKIVDFYGFENIEASNYVGLPNGVGEITLQKFKDSILDNLSIVNKFINDSRYNYMENNPGNSRNVPDNKNGMSVCFTGKLNTMSRTEASKKAEAAGYEVKGAVNKGLTYLVTNTPDSGSSKNKSAKKFGTKVITEEEFLKLISNNACDISII